MVRRMFGMLDCPPKERLRRIVVLVAVLGVIYVPGAVTFVMLVTGNA